MIKQAKDCIKDLPKLEGLRCTVCFEVEPSMMRCKGPCKTPLCLQCATTICKSSNTPICPQRCSNPLFLEPIPDLELQFLCPYMPDQCRGSIGGLEAFKDHCKSCVFITVEALQEQMRIEMYECQKGHALYFLDEDVISHALQKKSLKIGEYCWQCAQNEECRSYCEECSSQDSTVVFCHACRPIPCSQKSCPIGHEMFKVQLKNKSIQCDRCGSCVFLYSSHCYLDVKCFFYLCETCYQQLPKESHLLLPLQTNLTLKTKRNMSLHEVVMTKLMNKRTHQEAVRYLATLGDSSEEDEDELFQQSSNESPRRRLSISLSNSESQTSSLSYNYAANRSPRSQASLSFSSIDSSLSGAFQIVNLSQLELDQSVEVQHERVSSDEQANFEENTTNGHELALEYLFRRDFLNNLDHSSDGEQ